MSTSSEMLRPFGDQFVRAVDERTRDADLRTVSARLFIGTLRETGVEYIPFTRRVPVTQDFLPKDEEQALYERISAYLQREGLIALRQPAHTYNAGYRKLLASSTSPLRIRWTALVRRLEILSAQQDGFS